MAADSLKQKLLDEGFPHVYEWQDKPGTVYEKHAHQGAVSMYILAGSVTLSFKNEKVELKTGDRYDVPMGKEHETIVGPEGCSFLVGEMIEGDS